MFLERALKHGAIGKAAVVGDGIVRQTRLLCYDALGLFDAQGAKPCEG